MYNHAPLDASGSVGTRTMRQKLRDLLGAPDHVLLASVTTGHTVRAPTAYVQKTQETRCDVLIFEP